MEIAAREVLILDTNTIVAEIGLSREGVTAQTLRWFRFLMTGRSGGFQDGTGDTEMARKKRRFTPEFKARVAREALRERDSVQAGAARQLRASLAHRSDSPHGERNSS